MSTVFLTSRAAVLVALAVARLRESDGPVVVVQTAEDPPVRRDRAPAPICLERLLRNGRKPASLTPRAQRKGWRP